MLGTPSETHLRTHDSWLSPQTDLNKNSLCSYEDSLSIFLPIIWTSSRTPLTPQRNLYDLYNYSFTQLRKWNPLTTPTNPLKAPFFKEQEETLNKWFTVGQTGFQSGSSHPSRWSHLTEDHPDRRVRHHWETHGLQGPKGKVHLPLCNPILEGSWKRWRSIRSINPMD